MWVLKIKLDSNKQFHEEYPDAGEPIFRPLQIAKSQGRKLVEMIKKVKN